MSPLPRQPVAPAGPGPAAAPVGPKPRGEAPAASPGRGVPAVRCMRRCRPRVFATPAVRPPLPAVPEGARPPTQPSKSRLARRLPRPPRAERGPAHAGELPSAARPRRRPPPPARGRAGSEPGYARARLGEGVPARGGTATASPRPHHPGRHPGSAPPGRAPPHPPARYPEVLPEPVRSTCIAAVVLAGAGPAAAPATVPGRRCHRHRGGSRPRRAGAWNSRVTCVPVPAGRCGPGRAAQAERRGQ